MKCLRLLASLRSYVVPADHRHHWPGMVVLLASLTAGCAADHRRPVKDSMPPLETMVRELHPAGPTVVRSWRSSADTPPYRIEIRGARSGRLLIGQARLLYEPGGHWFIVNSTGLKLPLPADADAAAVVFEESGQRWQVHVLKRVTPSATTGVAMEDEPTLDLRLDRMS